MNKKFKNKIKRPNIWAAMASLVLAAMVSTTSVFAYSSQSDGTRVSLTPHQIAENLGDVRYDGIFSRTFENNTNMDSNVAVQEITGSNADIGAAKNVTVDSKSPELNVHLKAPAGQYTFGLFTDEKGTKQVGNLFQVNVDQDGNGGVVLNNVLVEGKIYYIMPVKDGQSETKEEQVVTMKGMPDDPGKAAISYIGRVNCNTSVAVQLKKSGNYETRLYLNSNASLSGHDTDGQRTITDQGKTFTVNRNGQQVSIDDGSHTPDFDSEFQKLSILGKQLNALPENVSDDNTLKVLNISSNNGSETSLTQAMENSLGYSNDPTAIVNKGIPLKADQYLVVNVQLDSSVTDVNIPAVRIGEGNQSVANRVIWNFGNYTGTVHTNRAEGSTGTILAPSADVDIEGVTFYGAVYADAVQNNGGFQRDPFQTTAIQDISFALHALEYDANGGENVPSGGIYSDGEMVEISTSVPTRRGYKFLGWTPDKAGKDKMYSAGDSYVMQNHSVTLYAQWKADEVAAVSLKYDGNGATGGSTEGVTGKANQQVSIAANGFTRTGYAFAGWNTRADEWYGISAQRCLQIGQ